MAKAENLKLDFMAKSIGIHFFEFKDMFRCYRNLKKHFGHMDTLTEEVVLVLRFRGNTFLRVTISLIEHLVMSGVV